MGRLSPQTTKVASGLINERFITLSDDEWVFGDGSRSLVYANIGATISSPDLRMQIVAAYAWTVQTSGFLGQPAEVRVMLAGHERMPYTTLVADELDLGALQLQRESAPPPDEPKVRGRFEPGVQAILLEGLIGPRPGVVREISRWHKAGVAIVGVVGLIDRQRGGMAEIADDARVPVAAAMTISGIAHHALSNHLGGMNPELYEQVLRELNQDELDPGEWVRN